MPDRNGTIWVTGAAGALGGALLRGLSEGAPVGGVGRCEAPAWLPDGARWVRSALPEAAWLGADDTLIHAAGVSQAVGGESAEALAAPHLAFASALAARGFAGRVLLLSSAAVYGEAPTLPISETAQATPLNAYGAHKLLVEAALAGPRTVILRLANVYGTPLDLSRRRVAALVLDALARETPFTTYGDGSSLRDYLFVSDFVAAVRAVLAADAVPAVLNLGSGTGTSLNALIAEAERLTGRRLDRRSEGERAEAPSSVLDISRMSALGWAPRVSLPEGLARLKAVLAQPLG